MTVPLPTLSLLLFATLAALSHAQCLDGTFLTPSNTCEPCTAGTYTDVANATSCVTCPVGYFGLFNSAAFFNMACFPCPPNTFSNVPGATACLPCPRNRASGEGFSRCARCGPGMRVRPSMAMRDMGNIGCNKCPAGTFSKGRPTDLCTKCDPGWSSRRGSSNCFMCPAGTYSDRNRRCRPCAAGTFTEGKGSSACSICPPGYWSPRRSNKCFACKEGTYAPFIGSKRTECMRCPKGSSNIGTANAGCKTEMGCPFGTFEDLEGKCKACIQGERLDEATMTCVKCGDGEISEGGAITVCRACGRAQEVVSGFDMADGGKCACQVGYQRADARAGYEFPRRRAQCILCPPFTVGSGEDRPITGSRAAVRDSMRGNWEPKCVSCPEGSNPVMRADLTTECVVCKENETFNTRTKTCEVCMAGSMSAVNEYRMRDDLTLQLEFIPEMRTQCIMKDTGCPALGFRNEKCVVTDCPMGLFSDGGRCVACNPGEQLDALTNTCLPCPDGTTSLGWTDMACFTCPENQIAANGECRCAMGQYLIGDVCMPCPRGQFNPFSPSFRQEMCYNCPRGTFSSVDGSAFCESCPIGSVTTEAMASGCRECPEGAKQGQDIGGKFLNKCVPEAAARALDTDFMEMLDGMTDF